MISGETVIIPVQIDFYLDFISPFGFLARHGLAQIATRHALEITYHPVDIGQIKRASGNTGPSNRDIPSKFNYLTEDVARWAKRYQLPMVRYLPGPNTRRLNKGLFQARDENRAGEYVEHAWNCVWRDGLDPGLERTLVEVAGRMQWQVKEFIDFIENPVSEQRFNAEINLATQKGVFGVPTYCINDQMWWGNDRLDFVEQYLEALH